MTQNHRSLAPLLLLALSACGGSTAVVKPPAEELAQPDAPESREPTATDAYDRGLRALAQRNWSFAVAAFETAASIDPEFVEAHVNLSVSLLATDRRGEALETARRAAELDPDDVHVRYQLACALGASAEFEQADALLYVLEADSTVGNDARLLRARHALLDGRPDDVFAILVQEIESADDAAALNLLGVAAEHIQTDDDARAFYEQALAVDTQNLDALRNLAMLELRQGHDDRAAVLLQQFLDLAPAEASDRAVVESRLNNLLADN